VCDPAREPFTESRYVFGVLNTSVDRRRCGTHSAYRRVDWMCVCAAARGVEVLGKTSTELHGLTAGIDGEFQTYRSPNSGTTIGR
jgi:hypothetical protein